MPSKRYEGINRAERDFTEALERLEKGTPRHQRLRALAAKGALRITISSVALEAGRSRTLIGTADCAYPAIRNRILDGRQPTIQRRTQDDIIAQLRRDNQALKAENARIATQLADAVAATWRLKKELDFQKELQKRSRHRDSKVVPFERSGG
jgi:hypothetical protein